MNRNASYPKRKWALTLCALLAALALFTGLLPFTALAQEDEDPVTVSSTLAAEEYEEESSTAHGEGQVGGTEEPDAGFDEAPDDDTEESEIPGGIIGPEADESLPEDVGETVDEGETGPMIEETSQAEEVEFFAAAPMALFMATADAYVETENALRGAIDDAVLVGGEYSIQLNAGFSLTAPVTIPDGAEVVLVGNGITLGVDGSFRHFIVDEGIFTLDGVTLHGGGIDIINGGDFTLRSGNITGGSAVNGGGVYVNGGALTILGGSISGNTATDGGGVYLENTGMANIHGGAISGNTATADGGGLYVGEYYEVNFHAGSITGNMADGNGGGAFVAEDGWFNMQESGAAISGNSATNGGGVYSAGDGFFMVNGLVGGSNTASGNTATQDGGGLYLVAGTATFDIGSILHNTAGGSGGGVYIREGSTTFEEDMEISYNTARADGGGIGFESTGQLMLMGTTLRGNTAGGRGGAVFADRAYGLHQQNGLVEGNTAVLGGGIYFGGEAFFMDNDAAVKNNTAVQGGGLYLLNNETATVCGHIVNNKSVSRQGSGYLPLGGGIAAFALFNPLELMYGELSQNSTEGDGGGLYVQYSEVVTEDFLVNNNVAAGNGGGIYLGEGCELRMEEDTLISGNRATKGGGLYAESNAEMKAGASINNNTAVYGGGLYVLECWDFQIKGGTINQNEATANGGGVYVEEGNITLARGSIGGNTAAGNGGGVYTGEDGMFVLNGRNTAVSGNTATNGGGVYSAAAGFRSQRGTVGGTDTASANTATLDGGGVYLTEGMTVYGGTIQGNTAGRNGGGLYIGEHGATIDSPVIISDNTAGQDGGGIYFMDDYLMLAGPNIRGNTAGARGGGVYARGDGINMEMSLVEGNTAILGGGVYSQTESLRLDGDGTVRGNTAVQGGGIYSLDRFVTITGHIEDNKSVFRDGAGLLPLGGGMVGNNNEYVYIDTESFVNGNSSEGNGGGVFIIEGPRTDVASIEAEMKNNSAALDGGAVFTTGYSFMNLLDTHFEDNKAGNGHRPFDVADTALLNLYDTQMTDAARPIQHLSAPSLHTSTDGAYNKALNNLDVNYPLRSALTVSYNPCGGTAVAAETVAMGSLAAGGTTTREGYTFLGWFTAETGGFEWQFATMPIYNDITLYAHWQAREYTLSFNANGGSETPAAQRLATGQTAQAPITVTRTGYTFLGWQKPLGGYWAFGGTGADTMPPQDTVLTADWRVNSYDVLYHHNDGSGAITPASAAYDSLLVAPANPTRPGYTFGGWKTADGATWDFAADRMPAADLNLYANWLEAATSVVVPPPTSSNPTPTTTSRGGSSSVVPRSSSVAPSSSSTPASSSVPTSSSTAPVVPSSSTLPPVSSSRPEAPADDASSTFRLFGNDMPLGGFTSNGGWGLLNLLMAVLALFAALYQLVRGLVAKDMRTLRRIIALLTGLVPMLLFLILENKTQMQLVSRWTPLILVFFLVHIAVCIIAAVRSKGNDEDADEDDEPLSTPID